METRVYGAQNFEPKFFTGDLTRFYLPLFFDIVLEEKSALIVTLGLGDAQAHLALCQAVSEQNLPARCVGVRRARADESTNNDPAWQCAERTTTKFFATISQLIEAMPRRQIVQQWHHTIGNSGILYCKPPRRFKPKS
jgi:hypothetical protein